MIKDIVTAWHRTQVKEGTTSALLLFARLSEFVYIYCKSKEIPLPTFILYNFGQSLRLKTNHDNLFQTSSWHIGGHRFSFQNLLLRWSTLLDCHTGVNKSMHTSESKLKANMTSNFLFVNHNFSTYYIFLVPKVSLFSFDSDKDPADTLIWSLLSTQSLLRIVYLWHERRS